MLYSSEESRRVWASVKALYLKEAPCTPLYRDFLLFKTQHTVLPNNELSVQHPKCLDPFNSDHF
jgi:hypothetical protein